MRIADNVGVPLGQQSTGDGSQLFRVSPAPILVFFLVLPPSGWRQDDDAIGSYRLPADGADAAAGALEEATRSAGRLDDQTILSGRRSGRRSKTFFFR